MSNAKTYQHLVRPISLPSQTTTWLQRSFEQQHQLEQNLNASADNSTTAAATEETAESTSENNDDISHKEMLSHISNIFKSVLERSSHVEDLICGDSDIIMDDDDSDTDDKNSMDVDVDVDEDRDDSGIPKKAASTTTTEAAAAASLPPISALGAEVARCCCCFGGIGQSSASGSSVMSLLFSSPSQALDISAPPFVTGSS